MTQHLFRQRLVAIIVVVTVAISVVRLPAAQTVAESAMPQYDATGALQLPGRYQQWVFVGTSLGLSYSEGARGAEMFHETLMEPSAYEHYVRTGEFREGTMLALLLHPTESAVLPGRQGRFAGPLGAVEMAVKDTTRHAEGWAYYNFGGAKGLRDTAQAMPQASCFSCHKEHAKYDNVFVQFYPLLAAAHLTSSATPPSEPRQSEQLVALSGLDPVLLIEGREERGKAEIIAMHEGYQYQFVSEPNRQRFAADPARFAIQNKMCLVVPDAPIDPALFAVHEQRVYAFATPDCVQAFKADPKAYLPQK